MSEKPTIDIKKLDAELVNLINRKNKLATLSYDSKDYDKIEEELHDLEDDFVEEYGDYFEEVLEEIHAKHCPDTDVLLPIAYLAQKYSKVDQNPDGTPVLDVTPKDGVWVDAEKFPGKDARLVLLPYPPRIQLMVEGKGKQVVWQAE
ncbi:MAG TPA: hypothetical protein VF691_14620 [Cytophagaceae bacterium]|jgi:hypothetical protein